jgi:hypothetical protein
MRCIVICCVCVSAAAYEEGLSVTAAEAAAEAGAKQSSFSRHGSRSSSASSAPSAASNEELTSFLARSKEKTRRFKQAMQSGNATQSASHEEQMPLNCDKYVPEANDCRSDALNLEDVSLPMRWSCTSPSEELRIVEEQRLVEELRQLREKLRVARQESETLSAENEILQHDLNTTNNAILEIGLANEDQQVRL